MVRQVSKSVNGVIPLTGKAGEWLTEYLETTEADQQAQEVQERADAEFVARTAEKLKAH